MKVNESDIVIWIHYKKEHIAKVNNIKNKMVESDFKHVTF